MDLILFLNLLWLVPAFTWLMTRDKPQILKSIIRGTSFGLVVSPASMGLYALYYIGPIAALFGMLGLALSMLHHAPDYNLAIMFNLIPSHTVITGTDRLPIEIINIVIWVLIYGTIGFVWGYFKQKRKKTLTS